MAQRWYLNIASSAFYPSVWRGTWNRIRGNAFSGNQAAQLSPYKLPRQSSPNGIASLNDSAGVTDNRVCLLRFISHKLAAQTISGTVNLVMSAFEGGAAANYYTKIYIYVTQGDSDTVRGVLLDYTESAAGGHTEWPTTEAGISLAAAQALSVVAIQDGDRIVAEIGWSTVTPGSFQTGRVRWGTRGVYASGEFFKPLTDLTVGSTAVTTTAPYLEFSNNIAISASEPTNITPETAIDIATLPYTGSLFESGNTSYLFYWKHTMQTSDGRWIGAFAGVGGGGATQSYRPAISPLIDTVAGFVNYYNAPDNTSRGDEASPITILGAAGDIIYCMVWSYEEGNGTSDQELAFSMVPGPADIRDPAQLYGDIFISNDSVSSPGFDGAVIDSTTGIVKTFAHTAQSESGVIADSGVLALSYFDTFSSNGIVPQNNDIYIYDVDFTPIAGSLDFNLDTPLGVSNVPLATDGVNFYCAQYQSGLSGFKTTKFDQAGAIIWQKTIPFPVGWSHIPVPYSLTIAVSRDGSIMYLCQFEEISIVRYDLINDVFISDFGFVGNGNGQLDISMLSDNTLIIGQYTATDLSSCALVHLDMDGSVISSVPFTLTSLMFMDHVAPDVDDTNYAWIWIQDQDVASFAIFTGFINHIYKVRLSDGAIVTDLSPYPVHQGSGRSVIGDAYTTNYFGVLNSCPLLVMGSRLLSASVPLGRAACVVSLPIQVVQAKAGCIRGLTP